VCASWNRVIEIQDWVWGKKKIYTRFGLGQYYLQLKHGGGQIQVTLFFFLSFVFLLLRMTHLSDSLIFANAMGMKKMTQKKKKSKQAAMQAYGSSWMVNAGSHCD
jgi:hypothetical protein